jgi:hypothetical protein
MTEVHVSLDPSELNDTGRRLQEPLEEQLSSALRAAAERVRDDYRGEPVDEVTRRLLEQTRQGLHSDIAAAFEPDAPELRRVAEEIVAGRLDTIE